MKYNEPLWVPKGTVRALIALILVIATVISAVLNRYNEWLFATTTVTVMWYFKEREGSPISQPVEPASDITVTPTETEPVFDGGFITGKTASELEEGPKKTEEPPIY